MSVRTPSRVTVRYRGIPYSLDLARCRRALVNCHVKGEFESIVGLADAIGISRSTASRFFSGRPISLTVTLKVLHALHLDFDDVAMLVPDDGSSSTRDHAA